MDRNLQSLSVCRAYFDWSAGWNNYLIEVPTGLPLQREAVKPLADDGDLDLVAFTRTVRQPAPG